MIASCSDSYCRTVLTGSLLWSWAFVVITNTYYRKILVKINEHVIFNYVFFIYICMTNMSVWPFQSFCLQCSEGFISPMKWHNILAIDSTMTDSDSSFEQSNLIVAVFVKKRMWQVRGGFDWETELFFKVIFVNHEVGPP